MDDRLILMGVIGKPHGVRGQVRVNVFSEAPEALETYTLTDRKGRRFALDWAHENVAWLSEVTPAGKRRITDRNEAETLVNVELFVPRAVLPETAEEEFYFTDLIGLEARDESGKAIGKVANVLDYGAGTSLELSPGGRLFPFTKACVPVVNVGGGFVTVVPPAEIEVRGEAQ
ncbi:ribosome maturation factor RimM [Acidocella sp.]|uniref:ribosome maturation factor RimM n=1 Tax=Acidocella sp. TaxID=50710 RepID=UPI00260D07D3|nr:ribosome maturation factor RimM [Acidocella sp.]